MCKYLEELGAEFQGPGSRDNEGKTPLDIALSFGYSDVVEWIASTTHELNKIEEMVKERERASGNQVKARYK
jgi:ankyrin repeat protein